MASLCLAVVTATLLCLASTTVTATRELRSQHSDQISAEKGSVPTILRDRRQIFKRKPLGFFSIIGQLGDLISETKNETQQAYRQITKMLSESVGPDVPRQSTTTASTTSLSSDAVDGSTDNSTDATVASSTTAAPYRATRTELMTILRRNLKGLRNLFQLEWRQSLADSRINVRKAGREFRAALTPILASSNSSSTTTAAP